MPDYWGYDYYNNDYDQDERDYFDELALEAARTKAARIAAWPRWRRLWLWLTRPILRWYLRRRGYQVIDMRDSIRELTPDTSPFLTLLQHPDFKKRAQDAAKIEWLERDE